MIIPVRIALLVLAGISLSFFVVFSFFPFSGLQAHVVQYLNHGSAELPFSNDANDHLKDVRFVLSFARVLAAALLVSSLWALFTGTHTVLRASAALMIVVPLLLAFLPWDLLFSSFHAVLFPQGNWRFPADSLLIRTFPESLFRSFAIAWGAVLSLMAIALFSFSFRKRPT